MTLRNELGAAAGPYLLTTRDSIGFPRDGDVWVDAVEFATRYAAAERWDAADSHFEAARAMHHRTRSPPWLAHTDHRRAQALLARGRTEDRPRAQALLNRSAAASKALGMTRLSREVEELEESARAYSPGPAA
jgi:hypothetical protein